MSSASCAAAAARWTVPARIAVSHEDITFTGDGGALLHGTLYVPEKARPVGAIVVTHGASSPLRTSPLYQHLVQIAPTLGLAVLIYDRRGSGASSAAKPSEHFDVLAKIDQAKDKPWYKYLYMGTRLHGREHSDWREQIEMDPLKTLAMDRVPTLMIYGGEDPVVPVAPSVARVKALQATHPKLQLAVIPGADHGMQLGVSPRDLLDPAKGDEERPNAPAYFATLAAWLEQVGVAQTGASRRP